jgi:hypothetical protein
MVKNKKRRGPSRKKKQVKDEVSLSRFFDIHTRANHRKISIFKRIVTKQRIYIFFATLALIIVASAAAYAMNNTIDLNNPTSKPLSTNNTPSTSKSQTKSTTTDKAVDSATAQQSDAVS